MSLEKTGVWATGVWAFTVWGDGVWFEGSVGFVKASLIMKAISVEAKNEPIEVSAVDAPIILDIKE